MKFKLKMFFDLMLQKAMGGVSNQQIEGFVEYEVAIPNTRIVRCTVTLPKIFDRELLMPSDFKDQLAFNINLEFEGQGIAGLTTPDYLTFREIVESGQAVHTGKSIALVKEGNRLKPVYL